MVTHLKLRRLIFLFLLPISLYTHGMDDDSSGDDLSSVGKEVDKFTSVKTNLPANLLLEKGKTLWSNGTLNIFPFASGQGNFILLKYRDSIMILDGGTQSPGFSGKSAFDRGESPPSWDEFLAKNREVLGEIFSGAKIRIVLVTHPDSDHYDWLGGLFKFAVETSGSRRLDGVQFFLGGEGKDFEYCKSVAMSLCERSYFYIRGISSDSVFQKNMGTRVVTLNRKDYEYVNDSWVRWKLYRPEDPGCNDGCDNDEIEHMLSSIMGGDISILSPVPVAHTPLDNNSKSLVVSVNFGPGTVLFTGDATGNTLDAIYGDVKNSDSHMAAVSRRNRDVLKRVNFLIAPHHGSEKDGSPFWLSGIIKASFNSFVGAVFCAPPFSQFQHPNRYIDTTLLPISAQLWEHEIEYYREDRKRKKVTNDAIFITSFAKYGTYWLNLSRTGMFMFSDERGELQRLMSEAGWSMHTDRLLNLVEERKDKEFLSIVLNDPRELAVRNAKGETPFLYFLHRSDPKSKYAINLMLKVTVIGSDDSCFSECLEELKDFEDLHEIFKNKWMTVEQFLNFLCRKQELTSTDEDKLKTFPLWNKLQPKSPDATDK